MFEKSKINKIVEILEEYLRINDVIYGFPSIASELKEVEEKYRELNIKCGAGIKGYELYTDEYVFKMKCQKLNELFSEYPALKDWALGLWQVLNKSRKHQQVYAETNMSLGNNKRLTPEEILINEIYCKKRLENIRVYNEINEIYKRK